MPIPTYTTVKPTTIYTHSVSRTVTDSSPDFMALLTLLLPLITFAAGYYLNDLVERRKERRRLKQVKDYFFTLTADLERSIANQSKAVQNAAGELTTFQSGNYMIGIVVALKTERIRAIPNLDLYNIFIDGKPDTEANTVLLLEMSEAIDFVDEAKKRIQMINEHVLEKGSGLAKQFQETIDALLQEHSDILHQTKISGKLPDPDTSALIMAITDAANKHLNREDGSRSVIQDVYKSFVAPLYQIIRTTPSNKTNDKLMSHIYLLNREYNIFEHYRDLHIAQMNSLAVKMNNTLSDLKKINAKFRS